MPRYQDDDTPDRWEVPTIVKSRMIEIARQFRKEPTSSEGILWHALRNRKLEGCKFRRRQPIGCFVVDFFCADERLIVEVDGLIHQSQQVLDKQRQELLESLGLRFLRLSSELVETNLSLALDKIRQALILSSSPYPFSHFGRRGENIPLSQNLGEGQG